MYKIKIVTINMAMFRLLPCGDMESFIRFLYEMDADVFFLQEVKFSRLNEIKKYNGIADEERSNDRVYYTVALVKDKFAARYINDKL